MNPVRLTLLAIFSTLWFANANDATATLIPVSPQYVYFFTAASAQPTDYNGSSITIQDLSIVAWDLFGDPNGGLQSGTGDGSFVQNNGVLTNNANTWTGSFSISSSGPTAPFGISSPFGTLTYFGSNTSGGGPTSGS